MKRKLTRFSFSNGLILCLLVACGGCASNKGDRLFDGSTLTGWRSIGGADWTVVEGEIVALPGGDGMLVSDGRYSDYQLSVEFWVDHKTNSGIFIHCQNVEDISPSGCYEINIWDDHPRQEFRTGAIVTRVSPLLKLNTAGHWNLYEITAAGGEILVRLNNQLISRLDHPENNSGHIALQRANGGEVKFRRIKLQGAATP